MEGRERQSLVHYGTKRGCTNVAVTPVTEAAGACVVIVSESQDLRSGPSRILIISTLNAPLFARTAHFLNVRTLLDISTLFKNSPFAARAARSRSRGMGVGGTAPKIGSGGPRCASTIST